MPALQRLGEKAAPIEGAVSAKVLRSYSALPYSTSALTFPAHIYSALLKTPKSLCLRALCWMVP